MTERDMQTAAKKAGRPWDIAKGMDGFLPVSDFIDSSLISDPHNMNLELKINGVTKQKGNTKEFIFKIPQMIAYIS